ncbi:MAG: hypothetical protein H6907_20930 [Hyphomicrobiales bacterium]|nr:hypothetical protein [Hyphomicrobiales bacterium]MCP5374207.1 hypothetical protein [Hyphomicrobiales bacterium]
MSERVERIEAILAASGVPYEVIDCDPALADTAVFCEHYGYSLDNSANVIVVASKTGEKKYAACVVLAVHRLDVNKVVRKKLEARKVSFADPDETRAMTGMEIGGVTAIGLPPDLPLWVDARVMDHDRIILGGGGRDSKIICSPRIFEHTPNTEIVEGLAK